MHSETLRLCPLWDHRTGFLPFITGKLSPVFISDWDSEKLLSAFCFTWAKVSTGRWRAGAAAQRREDERRGAAEVYVLMWGECADQTGCVTVFWWAHWCPGPPESNRMDCQEQKEVEERTLCWEMEEGGEERDKNQSKMTMNESNTKQLKEKS